MTASLRNPKNYYEVDCLRGDSTTFKPRWGPIDEIFLRTKGVSRITLSFCLGKYNWRILQTTQIDLSRGSLVTSDSHNGLK